MNHLDMYIGGLGLELPARLYEIKDLQRYHSQSNHTPSIYTMSKVCPLSKQIQQIPQ